MGADAAGISHDVSLCFAETEHDLAWSCPDRTGNGPGAGTGLLLWQAGALWTGRWKRSKKVYPGAILLRDATFVHINYGEPYENPYIADYDPETGCFLLLEDDQMVDEIDFVPRPSFYGQVTSKKTPMEKRPIARSASRAIQQRLM